MGRHGTAVPDESLVALFEARVAQTPHAVAVVSGRTRWTYAELDAEANRFAHRLIAQGVRRGAFVALVLPRSARMVAAVIGVLKAGAAYVPVDADHPPERVAYVLADARPPAVIGTEETLERSTAGRRGLRGSRSRPSPGRPRPRPASRCRAAPRRT